MADGATIMLALVRLSGAAVGIVHDCDEVYNYWEPLHYLVEGSGMQTWEYSSQFALRPYLYLLLHWPVVKLAVSVLGHGSSKVYAFYALRAVLSLVATLLEVRLVSAARRHLRTSWTFGALLALCTGTFLAPSTLLPSTLAMYGMTSAVTGVLNGNLTEVVVAATLAVLLAWPVAGIAFLPFAVLVLLSPRLGRSFVVLFATAAAILVLEVVSDWHFYGRPTVALLNFLRYNVAGGGDSALYGVEAWHFYLLNGTLNFNIALLLALAWPFLFGMHTLGLLSIPWQPRLAVAIAPLYVWLLALSALPHKEERFLYVVYPQIVLAAACVLDALPRLASDLPRLMRISLPPRLNRDALRRLGGLSAHALLLATIALSASRTKALLRYYSAPLGAWHAASQAAASTAAPAATVSGAGNASSRSPRTTLVCTGAEWYHFPSSFFLPRGARLAFVDSGFGGLLPKPFDPHAGGTRAAPPELNDRNQRSSALLVDAAGCDFFVGLANGAPELTASWDVLFEADYLENLKAPFPLRSFWMPGCEQLLPWSSYELRRRKRDAHAGHQEDSEQHVVA